jgi:hypothetical protein
MITYVNKNWKYSVLLSLHRHVYLFHSLSLDFKDSLAPPLLYSTLTNFCLSVQNEKGAETAWKFWPLFLEHL